VSRWRRRGEKFARSAKKQATKKTDWEQCLQTPGKYPRGTADARRSNERSPSAEVITFLPLSRESMHATGSSVFSSNCFISGGNDLQERKKLLVEGADALVVLPGGTGTWDELWEMACARNLGFHSMPIVCVNVEGFYEDFKAMLRRAHADHLLYAHPGDIVHFEDTPEAAVKWVEAHLSDPESNKRQGTPIARKKPAASTVECEASLFGTEAPRDHSSAQFSNDRVWRKFALFSAGLSLGFFVASRVKSSR